MLKIQFFGDNFTINIDWKDNELCMIDNKRMMHGRRKILENEGLFERSRKRILPKYPKSISVITSPNSSAWEDIKKTIQTRYYRAPEVIYDEYDIECDMWSIGCIIYELITGEYLFDIISRFSRRNFILL